MTIKLKRGLLILAFGSGVFLSSSPTWAQTTRFDIPAEDAVKAIPEFARQAGIQVVAPGDQLKDVKTPKIEGDLELHAALTRLLAGTGIEVASDDGQTIVLRAAQKNAEAVPDSGTAALTGIETVLVTAEKRVESSRNVPMSLTALSGDQLVRTQSYRLEDYVGKVPGLSLIDFGAMGSQLVIRGITTGLNAVNSQVATYIDETPFTGQGPYGASYLIAPNIDTFDMARVEVLRGPQGTLYGANALGGLLKYVTNAPDPSDFAATAQVGVSSVYDGGDGYDLHGMVNVPLADDLAVRVVGYDTFYPGFIDDPSRGLSDVNGAHVAGVRASVLYSPTSDLSIRLNAFYQDRSWGDWNNEDVHPNTLTPLYGNLIQEHLISQPGHAITELYNATINWNVGFANMLSTTSYSQFKPRAIEDYSDTYGPLVSGILGTNYGVTLDFYNPVQSFTQELRLASQDDQTIEWQIGGYFTNERSTLDEGLFPVDVTTKKTLFDFPTNLGSFLITTHYREYAAFANVDYHVTPTIDFALGGRFSRNDQTFHQIGHGLLVGDSDIHTPSSQGVFTYSGDARWHVTDNTMLYARVAEGFVPGGPNDVIATAPVPHSYEASTAVNYEAGVKSSFLDGRVTAEVSAFEVVWHKIQLEAFIGGLETTTNGGAARSKGAEWNFVYQPLDGLTFSFNGAYTDAYLTEPTPASVNGQIGDRLPSVPLWETSFSANYERQLFEDFSGFVGFDWRFSGSRYADFSAVGPRQNMPSYNIVDLRAGIETEQWTLSLYVKNVGNDIVINYLQPETLFDGGFGPQSAILFTPRTVGATITAHL